MLCTVELSAFKGNRSSCFPCFTEGEDGTCPMFASIAGNKDLVVTRGFVINHGEAVMAHYQSLDSVESVLVDICPGREIIFTFFPCQWSQN